MGEKGIVVCKQQLSDEFLNGFYACEETPQVEETAVCSETDVGAIDADLSRNVRFSWRGLVQHFSLLHSG